MSSLIRALRPKFDPGPTVENASVKPSAAPEVNVADLDKHLQEKLHSRQEPAKKTDQAQQHG